MSDKTIRNTNDVCTEFDHIFFGARTGLSTICMCSLWHMRAKNRRTIACIIPHQKTILLDFYSRTYFKHPNNKCLICLCSGSFEFGLIFFKNCSNKRSCLKFDRHRLADKNISFLYANIYNIFYERH